MTSNLHETKRDGEAESKSTAPPEPRRLMVGKWPHSCKEQEKGAENLFEEIKT